MENLNSFKHRGIILSHAEIYVGKDVAVEIYHAGCAGTALGAYVAQEVRVTPAQDIEGVDGLGSDQVQIWAPGLKTFEGTLTDLMVDIPSQLDLLAPFTTDLQEFCMKLIWDDGNGNVITMQLTGVIFPSGPITSPKNAKVILEMPFKAKSATVS
jgi:hypothetical protein